MQATLDRIDLRILELMQSEAELTATQIAEKVGLSQSPCSRRISRLRRQGYVTGRVATLDRRKLGLSLLVFVQVKFRGERDALERFEQAIARAPEVLECYMLMGEVDFLLRVVTRDVEHYEQFVRNHLAKIPGVQSISSSIAMSAVKTTTALPLRLVG